LAPPDEFVVGTDGWKESDRPYLHERTIVKRGMLASVLGLLCAAMWMMACWQDSKMTPGGLVLEEVKVSALRKCVCKVDCSCASNECCKKAMKKAGLLPKATLPKGTLTKDTKAMNKNLKKMVAAAVEKQTKENTAKAEKKTKESVAKTVRIKELEAVVQQGANGSGNAKANELQIKKRLADIKVATANAFKNKKLRAKVKKEEENIKQDHARLEVDDVKAQEPCKKTLSKEDKLRWKALREVEARVNGLKKVNATVTANRAVKKLAAKNASLKHHLKKLKTAKVSAKNAEVHTKKEETKAAKLKGKLQKELAKLHK